MKYLKRFFNWVYNLFIKEEVREVPRFPDEEGKPKLTARQYRNKYGKEAYRKATKWVTISPKQKELRTYLIGMGYRKSTW